MPLFWWMRLDFVFLVGRTVSSGVFWSVFELSMILGSLSANGWGCVLSCYLFSIGCPTLYLAGHLVELGLSVETKITGRALAD